MKITKTQLKHIIKEELQATLSEDKYDIVQPGEPGYVEGYQRAYDEMNQARELVDSAYNVFKVIGNNQYNPENPYSLTVTSQEAVLSIIATFDAFDEG